MRHISFVVLVLLLGAGLAGAQNVPSGVNYNAPGGTRTVVQGSLDVVSGGELDVESGGALKIAGTAITASAAEINVLENATATSASLNKLAAVTASADEINLMDGLTLLDGGSAVVAYQTGAITISGLLPGGDYYVGLSWADSTNDPGKTTWAITTDTLTVTCAAATSGTVHAIVIGK